ncbi:hypothetical protein AVEN_224552-1 [Araneus ventricosus]|uniref:Uncharacterized protein n=1 Tax=Araneus ventricosus TaxID=182803 RepID=A0A4Y2X2U3_ARAVE|nr:hypothetical protein AVEN_224552-1 [Araneus ventricosus]
MTSGAGFLGSHYPFENRSPGISQKKGRPGLAELRIMDGLRWITGSAIADFSWSGNFSHSRTLFMAENIFAIPSTSGSFPATPKFENK